jgi:hypothetical protein
VVAGVVAPLLFCLSLGADNALVFTGVIVDSGSDGRYGIGVVVLGDVVQADRRFPDIDIEEFVRVFGTSGKCADRNPVSPLITTANADAFAKVFSPADGSGTPVGSSVCSVWSRYCGSGCNV